MKSGRDARSIDPDREQGARDPKTAGPIVPGSIVPDPIAAGPIARLVRSAQSVMDGMAVTLSYLFRPPTTIQYPDRIPRPIVDTLPERYRGFLEVDLATCTACKACERDCPIGCIAIDLQKIGDVRAMTRFDIDMGKCMYCNICVESCPIPNQAPGDVEQSKCIRMTREFEGSTDDFSTLTFRFIRPGNAVVPFKPKKGIVEPTSERGRIARDVRKRAKEYNALAARWAETRLYGDSAEAVNAPDIVAAREAELAPMVAAAGSDPRHLEDLLYVEALAQTDCGACGYNDCRSYARAILDGDETDLDQCGPGGPRTARDLVLINKLRGEADPSRPANLGGAVKTPGRLIRPGLRRLTRPRLIRTCRPGRRRPVPDLDQLGKCVDDLGQVSGTAGWSGDVGERARARGRIGRGDKTRGRSPPQRDGAVAKSQNPPP